MTTKADVVKNDEMGLDYFWMLFRIWLFTNIKITPDSLNGTLWFKIKPDYWLMYEKYIF